MSRESRPPGFDMCFRPEEARRFGPGFRARLPSYVYLGAALLFCLFVGYGHVAPVGSFAFHWVVEAANQRPISSMAFASIALVSGVAAVLRSHLRGVVIGPDGIETLDVQVLGWPKIRHIAWPMIDRFRFDVSPRYVGVDLWNGTQEYFPEVGDLEALTHALVYIAEARAIPYRGGPAFDKARPYR